MVHTHYNPDIPPDPREWLALPEMERIRFVQNHHVAARVRLPNVKVHAVMHVVIENQIASGYGPSTRAMLRLQSEGLSRHDALHAIAAVLAEFIFELNQGQTQEQQTTYQARMNEAIEQLQADGWLSAKSRGRGR